AHSLRVLIEDLGAQFLQYPRTQSLPPISFRKAEVEHRGVVFQIFKNNHAQAIAIAHDPETLALAVPISSAINQCPQLRLRPVSTDMEGELVAEQKCDNAIAVFRTQRRERDIHGPSLSKTALP